MTRELSAVGEHGHLQVLHLVELDLDLEDAHQEEVVQPLVGVVDAELLEGVDLEDLEAEDVEEADELVASLVDLDLLVDPVDEAS